MLGHFKVCSFFVIFGPKMDQKRVKTQFFGIVALCINIPNDPTKDKKISSKNVAKILIFPFGGSDPYMAPLGDPGGSGMAFLH